MINEEILKEIMRKRKEESRLYENYIKYYEKEILLKLVNFYGVP